MTGPPLTDLELRALREAQDSAERWSRDEVTVAWFQGMVQGIALAHGTTPEDVRAAIRTQYR